jgi:predicted amidohydrolase
MSLSGYVNPPRFPEAVLDLDGPELGTFLTLTERYSAMVLTGFVEQNPKGKPFITQVLAHRGRLVGVYRKITIKDDEADWFSPGEEGVLVATCGGLTFGVAICADIHNEDVFAACRRNGAEVVLELAAPGLYGEQIGRNWQSGYAWWEGECQTLLGQYAKRYGIWVCVATQAGRTIDEDFPGGGYVFGPTGARLYTMGTWQPGAAYVGLDLENQQVVELTSTQSTA